jgi:hypothetical protein
MNARAVVRSNILETAIIHDSNDKFFFELSKNGDSVSIFTQLIVLYLHACAEVQEDSSPGPEVLVLAAFRLQV